jgi:gliding motility-associated-like protein
LNVTLTFLSQAEEDLDITLCQGEEFEINGNVYNAANPGGVEIFPGAASNGCDSILNIAVTFLPTAEGLLASSLCPGEELEINGTIYNELNTAGVEFFPDGSVNGCDSQLTVQLTFLENTNGLLQDTLEPGESITINGTVYDEVNPTGIEVLEGQARNGCDSILTIELTFVLEEIRVTFETRSPNCNGEENGSIIIGEITGGSGTYEVSIDGSAFEEISTFPFTFTDLSAGSYEITVEDSDGRIFTFQATVDEIPLLLLDLGPDQTIRAGENAFITSNVNFVPESVEWDPTTFLSCADCLDPVVQQPESNIQYTLTLRDVNGCEVSDQIAITLEVSKNVYIPSAFSPNGDGINDDFEIFGTENLAAVRTLRIFDRWGNLLFMRDNLSPQSEELNWDGTVDGQTLDPGVFTYFAEVEFIDGTTEILKGSLTLIR